MRTTRLALLGVMLALASRAAAAPTLVALLLDPEPNAARRRAIVDIRLKGAVLKDPGKTAGPHLLVRLDKETPLATSQTRIAFHGLSAGPHTISVTLVDADDHPLGAQDAVWLSISPEPAQP